MDEPVKENINIINNFRYKKEEDNGNCIFVKTAKKEYEIKNNEDLINFGLKNTCISFDLLEQYCKLFNKSQFEIRFFLNDRDIKLTSDKIDFVVYKKDGLDMVAENKIKEYMPIKEGIEEKDIDGTTFSYKSNIRINKDIDVRKTTILNLRLNEIIATFLNISCIGNRISYHSSRNFLKKHLSEFEKIGLLERERKKGKRTAYIVTDECINIAEKLKSLLLMDITPNKNLFMDKRIASKNNIKILFSYIRKDLISVLNKFDDFKFLLRLINDLDNIGRYTMMDIVRYCIENKYESEFIQIFIGNKGTAGKGAIINGRDICHSNIAATNTCGSNCNVCYKKHNINSNNRVDKLLYVRDVVAAKKYQEIITSRDLKILVNDPLTLKFLVRFGVTYYNKNILKALDVISSQVHMKSTGAYCPYKDEWRVSKNEI